MIEEILKKRIKESIGLRAKIFLHNGFRFEGKITGCDDKYVELLQDNNEYKILELTNVSDANIKVEVKDG